VSIIYNTLERLENLEKQGYSQTERSRLSNTTTEAHHPTLSTNPGMGIAFKIVVSIMLCLGGTAIFMLRTNVPAQLNNSLFSQSQTMETEPSIAAIPLTITSSIISETTKPALPVMVSTGVKETDGIPVGDTSKPETQLNDQIDPLDAELEAESELSPTKVVEVSSVVTGLLQAQAVELPSKASETVLSKIALSNNSANLAEAERHASEKQLADGHMNTEAPPALNATTTEIRPDLVGQTLEQARLALSRGQYFQALAVMESISAVPDNRADFWLIKGSVHLGLGQLDLAEESFELAQALVPGHAQTLVQLAVLKQEKGDHASALRLLKDAARRHRDVPEIYLNLGYSQQALGVFDEAGRSFKIFLDMTEGRSVYSEQRTMVSQWVSRGPAEVRSIVNAR
jgi:Flp pilus assembly protein TadD